MSTMAEEYKPVVRARQGVFSAAALVGSHTVILGWDVDPAYDRSNLLGFAVRRTVFDPASGDFTNVTLSDYKGKWITLCFYPGDFTFV